MSDILIRTEGMAGRITLTRPKALNAMTYAMCTAIEDAIDQWRDDDAVKLVLLDATGDKAFCAGGDIAELYATGRARDFAYGQTFWADEYRLNAKLATYPKPVVSFLQGYTMGGGVGLGCHGSHRIVGDSSRIAMPECGIGLVPDVGGSFILATAPGRLGEYVGLTGHRMAAGDAILCGFADTYLPETGWDALKTALCASGDAGIIKGAASPAPTLDQSRIDTYFAGETLRDIVNLLRVNAGSDSFAAQALQALSRPSPLAMACAVEILHRLRQGVPSMAKALDLEYRFTYRAMEHGDFLEGIRAQIIDKDRSPTWAHALDGVPMVDISRMLRPLGAQALRLDKATAPDMGEIQS